MPQPDIIDLETGWTILQSSITKLQNFLESGSKPNFKVDECAIFYTTIYNMCTPLSPQVGYVMELYNRYKESFKDYINSKVLPDLQEKHEELLLKEFITRWENHKVMVLWMSKFFKYLDQYRNFSQYQLSQFRISLTPFQPRPTVYDIGFDTFRDLVYAEMKVNVKDAVTALVDHDRDGEQIDHTLLKNVLGIFVEIEMGSTVGAHVTDFEIFLLQDLAKYYFRKGAAWIAENFSCPNYMVKVEECLHMEKERAGQYLQASSVEKLLEKVRHELFMALEPVASIFRQKVIDEGITLLKQAEDAANNNRMAEKLIDVGGGAQEQAFLGFLRKMIELPDKYRECIGKWFVNHSFFHKALNEALEVLCNKYVVGRKIIELLATFCDILLKKGGNEKLGDEAIDDTLEKVVKLLAYNKDKDMFAKFHTKQLAQRLLFEKNVSCDLERSFLTKLKLQCGWQFTSKMEGMVTDMTFAHDNQIQFEEYLIENTKSNLGIDLRVMVLSSGFWPSYESRDLTLPIEMVKCMEVFKEFYGTKTKNRKLTWTYSLGSCNLIGRFDAGPIELIVTTYQATVLLLFNGEERLGYKEVKRQVNFTEEDAIRVLHSLSCGKFKILNKDPNTRTLGQSDTFEFNAKFTNKMKCIKIPLPALDEKKRMIENMDKDRRYAIDALLVRIMKREKQMNHKQLVMNYLEQCNWIFKPEVKIIKKRIEDLITREYLERDIANPNLYNYMA